MGRRIRIHLDRSPTRARWLVVSLVLVLAAGGALLHPDVRRQLRALLAPVRQRRLTQLSNERGNAFLRTSPPGPSAHVCGVAEQGASCEVLESVTLLGTRFYRVKVRGKSLYPFPELAVTVEDADRYKGIPEWDAKVKAAWESVEALPVSEIEGWTQWVADD